MRLIDADKFELFELDGSGYNYEEFQTYMCGAQAVLEKIDEAPSIDAVEVVRCGECERRNKSADLTDTVYCKWLRLTMPKDCFCSYGEQKEGADND